MRRRFVLIFLTALLGMPAWGAQQTVTLSVPGMTCAACPITVKVALQQVGGVSRVEVNYPDREAVVTFDDTRTTLEALTRATADAGYPSTPSPSDANRP
ncbi:MAG: mercury resistance system periplasmic binding protein MerP [Halomonas sp.]|nr:mercury resistance system periplasmic binding protein MerP [Halomonas sp.]